MNGDISVVEDSQARDFFYDVISRLLIFPHFRSLKTVFIFFFFFCFLHLMQHKLIYMSMYNKLVTRLVNVRSSNLGGVFCMVSVE